MNGFNPLFWRYRFTADPAAKSAAPTTHASAGLSSELLRTDEIRRRFRRCLPDPSSLGPLALGRRFVGSQSFVVRELGLIRLRRRQLLQQDGGLARPRDLDAELLEAPLHPSIELALYRPT